MLKGRCTLFPLNLYFKSKSKIKTLFLIDILHMKDINASYGFKNGDAVIKQLKVIIKALLKNEINNMLMDTFGVKIVGKVVRHHSDVFSVTFYDNLSETSILKIRDIITKKLITHQFKVFNPEIQININTTIGCSKSSSKDLIIYAEKALYNAKQNFEFFVFFDSNLYKNESSSKSLIELIQYNIENKKVEPYFQAICCNKEDKTVKYEALMRLFDKDGNMLLPGAFLEKAKSYRLYVQLMQILINKVFDIIILHKIHANINLEYNDIINPLISDNIIARIQQEDIGKYLTIEILESERIQNFDIINEFIYKVKEYGVSIAIDDFGTGFSNYEYILKLNVDYLKIDGSLIQKIDEDIYMNLIKSIVMFCGKQNIKIVAEYVSDLKIQRYVKSLGIDYSQGYYIQKPISIEQIVGERSEG
ncbi:EAL domain-containing protein [Psychromonas hadalis]|uniref:EAL domain-containing protein n=1 Tax=Psychromonas hadalis TaxID=211669 RepID=UPI0003B4E9D3|nr:GGDEF domain-containing protein [Psychromonas hadalis]